MASATILDGSTCFFWNDMWNGRLLSSQFLELCSFRKDKNISVQSVINTEDMTDLFHLPLSIQAFDRYQQLDIFMQNVNVQPGNDIWTYIWGSNQFSSRKTYKHLICTRNVHPAYKWLWNSYCQPRRKFFFWLLLKERLSTRALLRRKNMFLDCYNCVLCQLNTEESLLHLFFQCPFALACWNVLGFAHLIQNGLLATIEAFRIYIQRPFFMEVFISMCWAI